MWGCCTSWFLSPVCRDAEHVFQRRKYRAQVQPAMLRKRGGEQCLYQHLQTQGAAHKHGAAQRAHSCMRAPPQEIGLRWGQQPRLQWPGLDQPSMLTSSSLTCGQSLLSSPCAFSHTCSSWCTWIFPSPLSPLSHPCFFHALLPVLLSPYSNFPVLPG